MSKLIEIKQLSEIRKAIADINHAANDLLGVVSEHLPTNQKSRRVLQNLREKIDAAIAELRESYKNFGGKKRPQ